jgi:hypothetical protein
MVESVRDHWFIVVAFVLLVVGALMWWRGR